MLAATDTAPTPFWDGVLAIQPAPPTGTVLLCAGVALLAVITPVWPLTRHLVTVAHEAGHAVAAVLSGRSLTGIRLHSDTSGLTVSRGRPRGPGMVVTLLAGYTGPALLGLGAAALLATGRPTALLWSLMLLFALLLLQIRNLFGLWVVLVCGVAVFAVTRWADPTVQTAAAYTVTWFLLLAAPRPVLEVARTRAGDRRRSTGRSRSSDPDQLARLTRIPGTVWVVVFLAITLGAALLGASWLLPDVADHLRSLT